MSTHSSESKPSVAILGVFTAFCAVLLSAATIIYALTPDADKASLRNILSGQIGTIMLSLPVIAGLFGLRSVARQNARQSEDLQTVKDQTDEQLDARIAREVNRVLDLRGLGHAPAVRLDQAAPAGQPGVPSDGR